MEENVYTLEIFHNEEEFRLIGKSNRRADQFIQIPQIHYLTQTAHCGLSQESSIQFYKRATEKKCRQNQFAIVLKRDAVHHGTDLKILCLESNYPI